MVKHAVTPRVLHIKSLWVKNGAIERQIHAVITKAQKGRSVHHVAQLLPPSLVMYGGQLVESDVLTESTVGKGRYHQITWDRRRLLFPTLRHLRHLARIYSINVIHSHDNRANFLALLTGSFERIPIISTLYGYVRTSIKLQVLEKIDRVVLRGMDHIILSSASMKEFVPFSRAAHTTTIPNAVEFIEKPVTIAGDVDQRLRETLDLPDTHDVVTMVGRLSPEKGHRDLFSAIPAILHGSPRTRFLIVGEGPLRDSFRREITRLQLSRYVRLLGFVEDLSSIFRISDLIVQPSLHESLPLTILEAMMHQRPVVATDVGSVAEAVQHDVTGLLVRPGHPDALAQAVLALLTDPERRRRLGEAGATAIRTRFSADIYSRRVKDVYDKILVDGDNVDDRHRRERRFLEA